MAVLSGLADASKYDQIFNLFKKQQYASPYMEKYVLEALVKMGHGDFAMERFKKRFGPMIEDPLHSTLYEGWEEGGYGGGSTNHAWSGGMLTVISECVCGVRPVTAKKHHMSTSWFIRNFKQYTGTSPMQYILAIRIHNAEVLLQNEHYNITEISNIVGYDNPLYFSRIFKKPICK